MCAQCAAGAVAAATALGGAGGLRVWLAAHLGPRALRAATVLLLVAAVLLAGLLA